jgi:hypothetical protein
MRVFQRDTRTLQVLNNRVHTSECNLSSKRDQGFSKLFLFLLELPSLSLHAPPRHDKAYALPANIYCLAICDLLRGLDNAALAILLALLSSNIVLVVLERKQEIVMVFGTANVAPDA